MSNTSKRTTGLSGASPDAWLDEILDNHRSETWATGWNNDATERAKTAILAHLQEREKQRILTVSDLAWCVGKLRGLGHPATHLEEKYGFLAVREGRDERHK